LISPELNFRRWGTCYENRLPSAGADVKIKSKAAGREWTGSLLFRSCGFQGRSVSSNAGSEAAKLSVGDVGNHAKRERGAADKHLVGIHAIDILARNHGPLDLVIVAAAADKRNVVYAGKRVRNLRAVEEDRSRRRLGWMRISRNCCVNLFQYFAILAPPSRAGLSSSDPVPPGKVKRNRGTPLKQQSSC